MVILQRANNLRTDRMLATLQSRVNAEWRVTAKYMREEKSCVNEDRETSVVIQIITDARSVVEYKWFRNYYTPSKAEDKEQHCTGVSRQSVGLRSRRD